MKTAYDNPALSIQEQFLVDSAVQQVNRLGPPSHLARDLATGHLTVERVAPGVVKWAFTARRRASPSGPITLPDVSGEWRADKAAQAAPPAGTTFLRR